MNRRRHPAPASARGPRPPGPARGGAVAGLLGLALAAGVCPASAQVDLSDPRVTVRVRDGVTRGDEYHAQRLPAEALEAFRGVLASDSTRFDALWRAARETVNLGMLAPDDDTAERWFVAAVDFARRAVAVEPDSVAGHEWLAIALGRRALLESPRERVELSEQVRRSAEEALRIDEEAAGAHNVLGQWHAEIQRLGGLTRFVAERLLGAETFREASWAAAERHLSRAVALEPEALIHRVALARVYLDTGRPEEARRQLLRAVDLPTVEPTDPVTRREAQELLRSIG